MSTDVEQVLREAMRDKADQAVHDSREIPLFPEAGSTLADAPPAARGIRRFMPLSVAAAILVIAAGTTVGVAISSADTGTSPAGGGSATVPESPQESAPPESSPASTPGYTNGSSPQSSSDPAPQSTPGGDATPGD